MVAKKSTRKEGLNRRRLRETPKPSTNPFNSIRPNPQIRTGPDNPPEIRAPRRSTAGENRRRTRYGLGTGVHGQGGRVGVVAAHRVWRMRERRSGASSSSQWRPPPPPVEAIGIPRRGGGNGESVGVRGKGPCGGL